MSRRNILIHVGYHKAASTVLQDQLFSQQDGPFAADQTEPRHALVHRFVVPQPLTFDHASAREHYRQGVLQRAGRDGKIAVLSHERFSGYPPSGGFDSTIIARRLHRTFPEARILFVIREQKASILSMYLQYITDGGFMSLRRYLTAREPFLKRAPMFSVEFYRYHRLVSYYRDLFGPEQVLCLPHEQLVRDGDTFVSQLMGFLDREPYPLVLRRQNVRRSATVQLIQRFVNSHFTVSELSTHGPLHIPRFYKRFGGMARHVPPGLTAKLDRALESRMKSLISERFEGAFADSNAILAKMIGQDLSAYGYEMPAGSPR